MIHTIKSVRTLAATLMIFGSFSGNANAAINIILGPTAIAVSATDLGGYAPGNIIDQSGLSANYTSGVTDFTAFTSSAQADHIDFGGDATSNIGGVAELGSFYFDLGEVFNVDSVATWGQDTGTATVTSYDLYYSDTFGAGGSRILIGSFSATYSPNSFAHTFTGVNTRYLELDVITNDGWVFSSRLNEIVFGGATVPEISSVALLMGLGALGITVYRRKPQ